jgi:hypothetical protein
MKSTPAALVMIVVALGLTSCGGGDDAAKKEQSAQDARDAKASNALSDSIMSSQESPQAAQFFSMKRKDADCIANGMVDEVGTAKLQKYGMLTKDLKANKNLTNVTMSPKDAQAATGVLFDCTDVPGMMQKAITSSGQIPKEMQACVTKTLNEENLRSMFTKVFSGKQQEAQQELIAPMLKCQSGG